MRAARARRKGLFASAILITAVHDKDPVAVTSAIRQLQKVIDALPPDDPTRAVFQCDVDMAVWRRFEITGTLADLDAAIAARQRTVDAGTGAGGWGGAGGTACAAPDRVAELHDLASALGIRCELTGAPGDAAAAVSAQREALSLAGPGNPRRPELLSVLGMLLLLRFAGTGELGDLQEAVAVGQEAVDTAGNHAPGRAGFLVNLANELTRRYERLGGRADIDQAVAAAREARRIAPAGDTDLAGALIALANALLRRAEGIQPADSAELLAPAAAEAPADGPGSDAGPEMEPATDTELATADLELAAAAAREAAEAARGAAAAGRGAAGTTGQDGRLLAMALATVGRVLVRSYGLTRSAADLDAAIAASGQAAVAADANAPARARYLSDASGALLRRFRVAGALPDVDAAVDAAQQAADAAGGRSGAVRAACLNMLVAALAVRFAATGLAGDLDAAIEAARQAESIGVAAASTRAQSALAWGALAAQASDWAQAAQGYEAAAGLLSELAPRGLIRGGRELQLSQVASFGPRAAACYLQLGNAERAAELLEQGRSIMLAGALGTRTELPPRTADLLRAARDGPVVLVNVSEVRSDALVLTTDGVRVVPLPGLTPQAVSVHVAEFVRALDDLTGLDGLTPDGPAPGDRLAPGDRDRAEAALTGVLEWLWAAAAGPVLRELGVTGPPAAGRAWPRIWWCPGGLLSFLPLHAAGEHGTRFEPAPQTVIDRAISSYTPTAGALLHARRPAATPPTTGLVAGPLADGTLRPETRLAEALLSAAPGASAGPVFVVSMPVTPGAADLPRAPAEAAGLRARHGPGVLILNGAGRRGELATAASVSAAMPRYPWAHFACQAAGRIDNPAASCLLLTDYETRPLTVRDIERLNLDRADLAFLSACSTNRTGGILPDESITPASAFQLAGYRQVVAALWPVDDRAAIRLTETFYAGLNPGDAPGAAAALHDAVRQLRATRSDQPSAWSAHVHTGA